jgi:hypothetical protein
MSITCGSYSSVSCSAWSVYSEAELAIFGPWASLNIYAVYPPFYRLKKQSRDSKFCKGYFSRQVTTLRSKPCLLFRLSSSYPHQKSGNHFKDIPGCSRRTLSFEPATGTSLASPCFFFLLYVLFLDRLWKCSPLHVQFVWCSAVICLMQTSKINSTQNSVCIQS